MENENDPVENVNQELENSYETITGMVDGFFAMLPKLGIALAVFIVMLLVASLVRSIVKKLLSNRTSAGVGLALGRIAYIAVVFAGFLMAVAIVAPSVGAAELLGVLGVGSVAIGFAFRDILQNFLAGLLILLREPFTNGDWIKFGEYEGIVSDISTRSTWLTTFDGQDVTIPNGQIFTNPVKVFSKQPLVRTQYDFGISYDANVDEAIDVIKQAVLSVDTLSDEKTPDVGVVDLAGSSVNLRARWWTTTDDVYGAKLEVMRAVKLALDDAGIEIPYPHRQLKVEDGVLEKLSNA